MLAGQSQIAVCVMLPDLRTFLVAHGWTETPPALSSSCPSSDVWAV